MASPQVVNNATVTEDAQQPFRLLDLPPELWSRICKFAVIHDEPIPVTARQGKDGFLDFRTPGNMNPISQDRLHALKQALLPAIAQTCRAIRSECLATFYGENVFFGYSRGHQFDHIQDWWGSLNSTQRRLVEKFYHVRGVAGYRVTEDGDGFPEARVGKLDAEDKGEVLEKLRKMPEFARVDDRKIVEVCYIVAKRS